MLIGGSRGSGKSVLLKCLLYQCVRKGAKVIIADFKGGVDYARYFRDHCVFIIYIEDLISRLELVVTELEQRKKLFVENAVSNLEEYNIIHSEQQLKRIIVAFDEVAEVLDKTGLDKEQKAKVQKIEELLSTIARLGRAFGIHLILSTQRLDANILSGQIRNNVDGRYCGRADDVLSKIVLDNTLASEEIPNSEQGLFLAQDGTVFRGYFFNDKRI